LEKRKYDKNGNVVYYEYLDGVWANLEYDENSKIIYVEYSNQTWEKFEYNEYGDLIYQENSDDGILIDKRNIIEVDGKKYKLMEE
jgi:hypothetical protein